MFRTVPLVNGTLPKEGFKSITVSEAIYNRFYKRYAERKDELGLKGVSSFSGYLTSILEELMERDEIFAKHGPFLEELAIEGNTIVLWDNRLDRSAEVVLQEKGLYCRSDERNDCVHVGFAYSIPRFYPIMAQLGIRLPRMKE